MVLLLWIICVFVSCVSHSFASVHCCQVVSYWERADLLALVGGVYCIIVAFQCSILGQVWYLIVSFPDLCHFSYFQCSFFILRQSVGSHSPIKCHLNNQSWSMLVAALWSLAGKRLISLLLFMMFKCAFVTFPCGILGHVCYLIVSIPDLCRLSYVMCIYKWHLVEKR